MGIIFLSLNVYVMQRSYLQIVVEDNVQLNDINDTFVSRLIDNYQQDW